LSESAEIGIIGGSGLYEIDGFTERREVKIETPIGSPSDAFILGTLEGRRVAFLARHGRGHRILPHELNFQANLFAMKTLGVERIFSISAVGSLKEEYAPLDIVIPDQFVDRTLTRRSTFFGRGLVAHVAFAHPFCAPGSQAAGQACAEVGAKHHAGGTYLCIEGPHFSTLAESRLYRSWGMDVIGMTNLQEAKLAREAEICYVTLAMVTDYDCWHPAHDAVSVDQIVDNLGKNALTAKSVLRATLRRLPKERECECARALRHALFTAPDLVPEETKRMLQPIIGRYMPVGAR
jgi:5'-methylthioadenosine phosphorylase